MDPNPALPKEVIFARKTFMVPSDLMSSKGWNLGDGHPVGDIDELVAVFTSARSPFIS
jgi:hypothetical protein